jgi:uncharacterized protein
LVLNGKVAGISGIFGGLLVSPREGERAWQGAFLLGLVVAAAAMSWIRSSPGSCAPTASYGTVLVAGLLVGIGTTVGGGCTSGHGVCGLSRGSARSLVATMTFMLTAIVTVYVAHHVLGAASPGVSP